MNDLAMHSNKDKALMKELKKHAQQKKDEHERARMARRPKLMAIIVQGMFRNGLPQGWGQ